jgi:YHS domain-containing protein
MRQLFFLALVIALGYLISTLLFPKKRVSLRTGGRTPTEVTQDLVCDPVCHLYLPRSEALRRKVRGQELFFCSPGCLDKFLALRS